MMSLFREGELDLAKERLPIFQDAASKYNWPSEVDQAMQADLGGPDWMTWVLAGIDSRESHMGMALDADGLGDAGHGHGEVQIDNRSHKAFCASGDWRDLAASLEYVRGAVIIPSYNYLADRFGYFGQDYRELFRGTLAAYNAGPGNIAKAVAKGLDCDTYTTGGDYGSDVLRRAVGLKDALT